MLRRLLWLGALCSCTQDFGAFDPIDGSTPEGGSTDVTVNDVGVDSAPQDVSAQDVTPDVGPVDAAPDVVPCTETGAITYGGHCYFLVSQAQDFNTAKANCTQASGAHLVTITTSGEQNAVQVLGSGTERWIGLYRSGGPPKDQTYAWITGENRNGYADWAPNEPNGTGQCGTFVASGQWNDEDCTISLAYICERE